MGKTALAALLALAFGVSAADAKSSAIYTVAKVAVEAEANDAVQAKQIALNEGQQTAFRALLKRLTHSSVHPRLPLLDDTMVERMVDGLSVRRESNSTTRYIATLDFTFEPNSVRDILNRFGLPYAEDQSPPLVLLPVMIEAGAAKTGTENVWYEALENVDYEHALSAIKLAPPRAEFSPAMISNPGSREVLATLKQQYRAENLVLALAETDAQATKLKVRLIGRDAVGDIYLERRYAIRARDTDEAARFAAKVAVGVIEGRWKTTRLASLGALSEGPSNLESVALTVQFTGLKQWQDMRTRLQRIPGLQNLDVKALNARGATISVEFAGGASRLAQAAQSQGLAIDERDGVLVLLTR
jgi:Uncharacterized protein conserved in bacteria (DUF2066)